MGWFHIYMRWIKIQEGYLGVRSPSPTPGPPAQGSRDRKVHFHNFWLRKAAGIELVEETSGAQTVPLKEPTHEVIYSDSLPLSSSTGVSSLKGTRDIQEETEVSAIKMSRGHCPFSKPSPHRASKLVPYLRPHQPG